MSASPPAVAIHAVDVSFGALEVLRDVDLEVADGEFVAIAGPNGGGKTTLLRTLLGLQRPQRGEVRLFGEPVQRLRERARVGYLRQRSEVGVQSPATVREVVAAGRAARSRRIGPGSRQDRAAVDASIARVGLAGRADTPVRELSGGLQQRTFLAKLLAAEPTLLALDEPTTGVDVAAQQEFGALLAELNGRLGVTILYVSHEFGAVEQHVRRLVLVSGGITYDGPPSQLEGHWHDPSHQCGAPAVAAHGDGAAGAGAGAHADAGTDVDSGT